MSRIQWILAAIGYWAVSLLFLLYVIHIVSKEGYLLVIVSGISSIVIMGFASSFAGRIIEKAMVIR